MFYRGIIVLENYHFLEILRTEVKKTMKIFAFLKKNFFLCTVFRNRSNNSKLRKRV